MQSYTRFLKEYHEHHAAISHEYFTHFENVEKYKKMLAEHAKEN